MCILKVENAHLKVEVKFECFYYHMIGHGHVERMIWPSMSSDKWKFQIFGQ